jgi:hypothetical protein
MFFTNQVGQVLLPFKVLVVYLGKNISTIALYLRNMKHLNIQIFAPHSPINIEHYTLKK